MARSPYTLLLLHGAAVTLAAESKAPTARTGGFDVVWNSPWPDACAARTITPKPDFARFGVRTNRNTTFNGDVVTTIYCPTHFSTFPHFDDHGAAVNGGIPQKGNLSAHLVTVQRDVEALFPDADYDGYAIIDWEVWMPWLLLASRSVWVNESIAYVRELHPSWPEPEVEAEAVRTWNVSATSFMVATLKLCVQLRPKAAWGYYGRPGCYSGMDTASPTPRCIRSVQARNDQLGELWAAGTALYPSVYIGPNKKYPWEKSAKYITSEIGEALRLRSKFRLDNFKVMAFTWYVEYTPGNVSGNWHEITSAADLAVEFDQPKTAGADGIVVWGSSLDAKTPQRCTSMASYFTTTLGPKLGSLH